MAWDQLHSGGRRFAALALRILLIAAAVWAVQLSYRWLSEVTAQAQVGAQIRLSLIVLMLVVHAILIAMPFVPGVETGIMLPMLQGEHIAAVYSATVAGLCFAFTIGHRLPSHVPERFLIDLRLHRAAALVRDVGGQSPQRRLARLRAICPRRIAKLLIRRRYILLALLINRPGDALVGAEGGIALTHGMSKLYAPLPTLITFLVAVTPIPFLMWILTGRFRRRSASSVRHQGCT